MKKIKIIAVILLMSAVNSQGMEQPNEERKEFLEAFKSLLPELQKEVITAALNSNNTIDEAIDQIKRASVFYNVPYDNLFNNLKDLTKFVHMLADKFNSSTENVANKFGTTTAQTYINLGKKLVSAIDNRKIDRASQAITQGADVNYTYGANVSLLMHAMDFGNSGLVKLLLDSGANKIESK